MIAQSSLCPLKLASTTLWMVLFVIKHEDEIDEIADLCHCNWATLWLIRLLLFLSLLLILTKLSYLLLGMTSLSLIWVSCIQLWFELFCILGKACWISVVCDLLLILSYIDNSDWKLIWRSVIGNMVLWEYVSHHMN